MKEKTFSLVTPYPVGRNQRSMVVLIPKDVRETLGLKAHTKLYVKIDEKGRLIYEIFRGDE